MDLNTSSPGRPNFLIIIADDLGFSDCGCFGSEIQTPHIDALAAEPGSLRFTEFHVAAACSPTRSMLMTGTDHHIAGLGQLHEFTRNSPAHQGQPGHEGYLNSSVVTLPELLEDGGYYTVMAGKWHLGLMPEHHPVKRGFKRSFALLPGSSNHYGYEPDYEDPSVEPGRFMEAATRALHAEDDHFVKSLPKPWYSSDGYTEKLLEYLEVRSTLEEDQPFFAYLPFSAPHWPLQAPDENTAKYRGKYSDGPDALRLGRVDTLKRMGLIAEDIQPHPVSTTPHDDWAWESLDDETRSKSARAMEVYAGMVDRMDWNIGRVISYLRSSGEYDNTFVIFMSDNGAEGASYEARPILGKALMEHIAKYYDNSLDNIGHADSFVWYGPRWAQAATAPSRLFKMFSTEGGCRVPLVVKPSKYGLGGTKNQDRSSSIIANSFCTVMDIVPTILDLAGLCHPGTLYKGRSIAPLRGRSWIPFLSGSASYNEVCDLQIHSDGDAVGFEVGGSGALRRGDYKITFVPAPRGPQEWELFNIRKDPGETQDLRETEPMIFNELLQLWEKYKTEVGVVGLAGEFTMSPKANDEFSDPVAWIKYIGRPELTPDELKNKIPNNVQ